MKKLLFALLSMSAIACADVRITFQLFHNGMEIGAGEMMLSDEQLKNPRMDEFPCLADANPEDCVNGLLMASVGACDEHCITMNCMLAEKVNGMLEVLAQPQIQMNWNQEAMIELANDQGSWKLIMTAEQI